MRFFYLSMLGLFILGGCNSSKRSARNVQLSPITVRASDNDYRATATQYWDITHTRVALSFEMKAKTAVGQAWIDLHPYFYESSQIVLDAQTMSIDSVLVNGKQNAFTYRNDSLIISLARTYNRNESLQLYIKYVAMPYKEAAGGSAAISEDRGLYFINTDNSIPGKPVQIWTQGETESNSHWVPTFDKPNERFTTQIELTVPDSFVTLSNGELIDKKKSGNLRTDIWKMDKPIQPYVMMFAIGDFIITEDKKANGKPVTYYVEPEYAPYAHAMFAHTPQMIEFFSDVTGVTYPWNKYAQVVVRDYVSGAMENTSATLFGEFMNQDFIEINDADNENVVSHELFHQWFGDYVTAESWSNLTVNESFATYGEQLWRRYKYGKASEQKLAFDDQQIYLNQTDRNDEPLVRHYYNSREDMFDRISYQKGASILRYLHGLMGDKAFSATMKLYLTKNALHPAEATHWRLAVEEVTGKDWNWFFNQWYNRGGHPQLDISYIYDDAKKQVTATFTQKQTEVYRLPMKVSVGVQGNMDTKDIDITKRTQSFTFDYVNNTKPIILPDVEHWLVGTINENKTPEQWLQHYNAAAKDDFTSRWNAVRANNKKLTNTIVQDLYQQALKDTMSYIRAYTLSYLTPQKNAIVRQNMLQDVRNLAANDKSVQVRAAAFDVLAGWADKDSKQLYINGITDKSYAVAGAALDAIYQIDRDTALILARQVGQRNSRGTLQSNTWYIIADNGHPADTAYLLSFRYKVGGRTKISYAEALSAYLKKVTTDDAFKQVLYAYTALAVGENISSYRASIVGYLFETAMYYKDEDANARSNKSREAANLRLNHIKMALIDLEKRESNKDSQEQFKTARKAIFGDKE